jgi:hypothetical protein
MDRLADARFIPVSTPDRRARMRDWLRDGARLWRAHPFGVLGLALAPIVFEGLCQLVPDAGIVVSKLLTPLVSAWALVALDARVRHSGYAPLASWRQVLRRGRPLLGLVLVALGVFAFQCAVAALLGGPAQAVALASGDMAALTLDRVQVALVLASGALPGMALMFAFPRVLFDGMDVRAALVDNARLVRRHARAVIQIGLLSAALVGGVVFAPWLLLILLPMALCTGYAAYRDVDRRDAR